MARLVVKFGTKVDRVLELDIKQLVVGRGSDAQLELDHELISRRHCQLRLVGDGFMVEDLGSKTGTLVNKEKVQAHILVPGDEIGVGPYTLVFEQSEVVAGSSGPQKSFESTGDFWAQAAADSGVGAPTNPRVAALDADEMTVPASALGARADGKVDMDDYQGTMVASADELARVRELLEVSQAPHLTVKVGNKVEKIAIEDTNFEVGFHDDADFQLPGKRFLGKKQFLIQEIGPKNFEVRAMSFWASVQVDGKKLSGSVKLKNGTTIDAGGLKFRFRKGD